MSENALMELAGAYSSSSSNGEKNKSAQLESAEFSDSKHSSNDDKMITLDDKKVQKKPKLFGPELQLHNYFSLPARQPPPRKRFRLQKILIYPMSCIQKEN